MKCRELLAGTCVFFILSREKITFETEAGALQVGSENMKV